MNAVTTTSQAQRRGHRGMILRGAALVVLVLLFATSCEWMLENPNVPYNVSASDGTYANRVEITWDAPETDQSIDQYDVYRSTNGLSFSKIGDTTGTSFTDDSSNLLGSFVQETLYYYEIRAVVKSDTLDSDAETGYALVSSPVDVQVSTDLAIYTTARNATTEYFRFLAQEGWDYEVKAVGATLSMLDASDLSSAPSVATTGGGQAAFSADRSGYFYIKAVGGSGDFSIRHQQ